MDLKWRQGFVIQSKSTEKLTKEQADILDKEEKCRVYRNFLMYDAGKSRELVAVFKNPQDAALAVKLHNAMLEVSALRHPAPISENNFREALSGPINSGEPG